MKNPKVASAQVKNVPVTRDSIKAFLKADINSLYSLSYELLSTPEAIDVLADKLYMKYLKDKSEKENKEQEVLNMEIHQDENV